MRKIGASVKVPEIFTVDSYQSYYSKLIPAIDFHALRKGKCLVPQFQKKRGRPKKKRIPSKGEESSCKQIHQCSICKQTGHNKKNCTVFVE
jgi:hypothetical protein